MVPRNRAGGRPVVGVGAPTSGLAPLTITSIPIVTHSKSLRTTLGIILVGRHNVLLYELTTPCRCTTRRWGVRDYVPGQVSRPAPTRRPAARPSLPIQTIHVARHHILLYVPTTYNNRYHTRRETQRTAVRTNNAVTVHYKAVGGERLRAGAGLAAGANASAAGSSLLPIQTIHAARHHILLNVPTTLCRCAKRQSTVRDYVPA